MGAHSWTSYIGPAGSEQVSAQVNALVAAAEAAGLVRTNDSGQAYAGMGIDKSGFSSSSAYVTYLMFRFDDALAADSPVFVKVEVYAVRTASSNTAASFKKAALKISVGFETDGAGQFIGPSAVITDASDGEYTGSTVIWNSTPASFVYEGGGIFNLAYCVGFAGNSGQPPAASRSLGFAAICRTRNADGLMDGRGVVFIGGIRVVTNYPFSMVSGALLRGETVQAPATVELCGFVRHDNWYSSREGRPVLQHPMAADPYFYPYTAVGMYADGSQYTLGDVFELSVGGVKRPMVALGHAGVVPTQLGLMRISQPSAWGTGLNAVGVGLTFQYGPDEQV